MNNKKFFNFNAWALAITIENILFTYHSVKILHNLPINPDFITPIGYLLIFRGLFVFAFWMMIWNDYDFSTQPRKLTTLEKAQRAINKGEYKKQLKEDKKELNRRKEISKRLKYIEQTIINEAKHGNREFTFDLPINYCVKDVELYLQNHGFEAKIDDSKIYWDSMLNRCYPLYIKW